MRALGTLLAACVVLAAAQAAALALSILLMLALVYGLFARPRETFGFVGLCIIAGLVERQPLACIGLVALITIANAIARRP